MSEHDWPLYANEPDRVILRGDLATEVIAEMEKLLSAQPSDYQAAYEWMRRNQLTLIVALEAAHRPLGYIAVGKKVKEDGTATYRGQSFNVWPDERRCQLERGKFEIDAESDPESIRREYIVAEVREVQP